MGTPPVAALPGGGVQETLAKQGLPPHRTCRCGGLHPEGLAPPDLPNPGEPQLDIERGRQRAFDKYNI